MECRTIFIRTSHKFTSLQRKTTPWHPLRNCLYDVKAWLEMNFVNLNESRTEMVLFKPNSSFVFNSDLGSLQQFIKPTAISLRVILDGEFILDQQINAVVKSSFYHLWLLSRLKQVLSFSVLESVIPAFISTRLVDCNALYTGISQTNLAHLQLVQNSAAHLLTFT